MVASLGYGVNTGKGDCSLQGQELFRQGDGLVRWGAEVQVPSGMEQASPDNTVPGRLYSLVGRDRLAACPKSGGVDTATSGRKRADFRTASGKRSRGGCRRRRRRSGARASQSLRFPSHGEGSQVLALFLISAVSALVLRRKAGCRSVAIGSLP